MCIHSPVDGQLGLFHLPAAVNVGVHMPVGVPAFSSIRCVLRSGNAALRVQVFEEPLRCCPQRLRRFAFSPAMHTASSVSTPSPAFVVFCFVLFAFPYIRPNMSEVTFGFNLHPQRSVLLGTFYVLVGP